MNRALRETLVAFADAHRLRHDWHEPDEQSVEAKVRGCYLDNAMGDLPWKGQTVTGEYIVEVTGPHGRVSINLANLLADYCALVREATHTPVG